MVLGFASLNFLGNFLGTFLGDKLKSSDKVNALALHWAAGMILSVVSVQIMPKILAGKSNWPLVFSLLFGGMAAIGVHKALEVYQQRKKEKQNGDQQSSYRVFSAVIADLFSDGITIGASSSVSSDFAILVVVGLIIGDFPEGFVNMSIFKEQGLSKKKRYLMALSLILPVTIGALGTYWIAKDASQTVKYSFLAFTVGLYLRAAVEDMIKKGHSKGGESVWQQAFFIFGFVAYLIPVALLSKS
ncbi:MAG: hypothetical protein CMJ16_03385 [Peredibacter sp.]|nr:hypothetical protein [Peredibacter sp.]